jgi:hypothetical protein
MIAELRDRDDGELRAETLASCEVNLARYLAELPGKRLTAAVASAVVVGLIVAVQQSRV